MSLLEVCIDSPDGIQVCNETSIEQIELCSSLSCGGLTPSAGLMKQAAGLLIPTFVLIRPREGHFCFNNREVANMLSDIALAQELGLSGVVLGAATTDNRLDRNSLNTLCKAAGDMKKTLHRVIDTVAKPAEALEQAIDLGFDNVLTSGGGVRAIDSMDTLRQLQELAQGRIRVMAGSGLQAEHIPLIYEQTGIRNYHASCRQLQTVDQHLVNLGFCSPQSLCTDLETVRQFQRAMRNLP